MGALNPKTNGSGTITAAASLFLASRYAASPLQGMLVAATTLGADTDTLASMAGTILGAIHGEEWLGHFASTVQDAGYIRRISTSLVAEVSVPDAGPVPKVSKRKSNDFTNLLKSLNVGASIRFPDGRSARVKACRTNVLAKCSSGSLPNRDRGRTNVSQYGGSFAAVEL